MRHSHPGTISRIHDGSAWTAMLVAILLHGSMLAWLLNLDRTPMRATAAAHMVLVEVTDLTPRVAPLEAITTRGAHGQLSPKARSAPTASRKRAAPAPRKLDRPRPESESHVTTPEGSERAGDSVAVEPTSIEVSTGGTSSGASTGADAIPGGGGARRHPHFRPPQVRRRYQADYPVEAYEQHEEGSVDVMVTIRADDSVEEAHVYQSSGSPALDEAAVDSVKRYVFEAARRDDEPTRAQAIVTIDWDIGPATAGHLAVRQPNSKYPATAKDVMDQRNCVLTQTNDELCRSSTLSIENRLRPKKE